MKTYFSILVRSTLIIIAAVLVVGGSIESANAASVSTALSFNDTAPTGGDTSIGDGLAQLTQWIFYIFYLLGGIFMGVGAFKLKQGDIPGFSKNMAGGSTLFFVPAIIKLFKSIGAEAAGG